MFEVPLALGRFPGNISDCPQLEADATRMIRLRHLSTDLSGYILDFTAFGSQAAKSSNRRPSLPLSLTELYQFMDFPKWM